MLGTGAVMPRGFGRKEATRQMSQTEAKTRANLQAEATVVEPVADTETPKGTVAILIGYAAVIVGLWGHMFLTMLERGVK